MYLDQTPEGYNIMDLDDQLITAIQYSIDETLSNRHENTLSREQRQALKELNRQLIKELNF